MPNYDRREDIRRAGSWIEAGKHEKLVEAYKFLRDRLNPDDAALASTWDNDDPGKGGWHHLFLKQELEKIDPRNQRAIDKLFADYVRDNRLFDEPLLAAREKLMNQNRYGWFRSHEGITYEGALPLLDQFRCRKAAAVRGLGDAPEQPSFAQRIRTALHAARSALHL
jgi:phytoene dehydrogenase-like protein